MSGFSRPEQGRNSSVLFSLKCLRRLVLQPEAGKNQDPFETRNDGALFQRALHPNCSVVERGITICAIATV